MCWQQQLIEEQGISMQRPGHNSCSLRRLTSSKVSAGPSVHKDRNSNKILKLPKCPVPPEMTASLLDCPSGPCCREYIPRKTQEQSWTHLALYQQSPASYSAQWPATWYSARREKQQLIQEGCSECERGCKGMKSRAESGMG